MDLMTSYEKIGFQATGLAKAIETGRGYGELFLSFVLWISSSQSDAETTADES